MPKKVGERPIPRDGEWRSQDPEGSAVADDRAGTAASTPEEEASPTKENFGLQIVALTCCYGTVTAVENLSLAIGKGKALAILGASGSGKSTVLRAIAGFMRPKAGKILCDSNDLTKVPPQLRDIGYVPQGYALFPHLRVRDNISFGLRFRHVPKKDARRRVEDVMDLVGLSSYALRYPAQLSGGQQQRVALARALVINPRLLLLDEPLSALDAQLRERIQVQLRELQSSIGVTTIYVTHDRSEAFSLADYLCILNNGRQCAFGLTAHLAARPQTRFVAEFLGNHIVLSLKYGKQQVWTGQGTAGVAGAVGEVPLPTNWRGGSESLCVPLAAVRCSPAYEQTGLRGKVLLPKLQDGRRSVVIQTGDLRITCNDDNGLWNPGDEVRVRWDWDSAWGLAE